MSLGGHLQAAAKGYHQAARLHDIPGLSPGHRNILELEWAIYFQFCTFATISFALEKHRPVLYLVRASILVAYKQNTHTYIHP